MKESERKIAETARIYVREFSLLERAKENRSNGSLSKEELLKEYNELGREYEKLLKQTVKITRIGDANQMKLVLANEKIEKQRQELAAAYKKMELLARTDPLTQLWNRRHFLERFQDEIIRFERSKKPFSVVLGDIDNFKAVNDRHGHDCGDFVLVSIAKSIKAMVRKQDVVGRWGGEEFILLLPESSLEGGKIVAEEARERIAAESYCFADSRISVTMSFGVSEFDGSVDMDTCIKQADAALYSGKRRGKNRVVLSKN